VSLEAWGDERADEQARGEELAKEGRFEDAIMAFKRADRIQPRAGHACLIALAYTRRELWSQAELFLDLCRQRANENDPLPKWFPRAEEEIKERLLAASVAPVTIEIRPSGAAAKLTVSSFAPDEVFEPRTIYLSIGSHVIFARADGYPDSQQTIQLRDKSPQRIVVDLQAAVVKPVQPPPPPPPPPGKRGTALLISGIAAGALGGAAHLWMGYERRYLVDARATDNETLYKTHSKRFDAARISAIGLYSVGAALLVTGAILRGTSPETTTVSAVPTGDGGAMVVVGWQR
jgi:hypothetical protein